MMTLFLSLALAATATETPPADAPPATQQAKPAKPKKICRSTVMTGSNIARRVCKTQDQWNTDDSEKLVIVNSRE